VRLNLQKLTVDSDGDGLTDIREISWGLDPRLPDSDRDGLLDDPDPDPLARNDSAFSLEDSLRQAALKFVLPEAILQDSAAVISVVTGDGREQSFFNHRCTILCNVSLPADNLHLGVPEVFGKDSAAIEVSYRGPLTTANGFTLLLKKTPSRRWRVVGLERRWSQ